MEHRWKDDCPLCGQKTRFFYKDYTELKEISTKEPPITEEYKKRDFVAPEAKYVDGWKYTVCGACGDVFYYRTEMK